MDRMEKPEGILITMPVRFFSDYPGGEPQFRAIMDKLNKVDIPWGQTISSIPKHEVLYCYLVFGGKVQYRLNIMSYEKGTSKEFNDGGIIRVFRNKNWVNLCAPIIPAPIDIPMRGFQGFRYTEFLF